MKDLVALHKAEFDAPPLLVARAPGVVKFFGEHTEPCDGLVLAAATSFSVYVALSERKDAAIRFFAADVNERKRTTVSNLKYKREDRWANLLKAPLSVLADSGIPINGYSFTISGDIPQGLGFSSSLAIIAAVLLAVKQHKGLKLGEEEIRRVLLASQRDFLGGQASPECVAGLFVRKDHAILTDLKKKTSTEIGFPIKGYSLVVTDSRLPRFNAEADLKQRQSDCRRGLHAMVTPKRQIKSLRDANFEDLSDSVGILPESVRRRCTFIMEEFVRAQEAAESMDQDDLQTFGKLLVRSHESLRDLFEISCPEIDWLVKRAMEVEGCVGSRIIGSGFGGCTLSLMKASAVDEYKRKIEEYERIFGFKPTVRTAAIGERAGVLR
jgi:galactokinase